MLRETPFSALLDTVSAWFLRKRLKEWRGRDVFADSRGFNMGWEADRVLEGIFMWGAPLNIWEMELYHDRWGDMGYYRIHMNLDDDPDLVERLKGKMKGPIHYYQRLIIMEGPQTRSVPVTTWREWYFYKVWLYSLQTDYRPSRYPYDPWPGFTLGIAFDKSKANDTSIGGLFGGYKRMRSRNKRPAPAE